MNTVKAMNDFIRKTKLYGALAGMLCLLVAGLSSCVQDELASPGSNDKRAVEFSIQVAGMSNKVLSRAASARTDLSRIEQVQVFLAKGDNIVDRYFLASGSTGTVGEDIAVAENNQTGFITGSSAPVQPTDGTKTNIKFRVSSTDMQTLGVTHIYVVANYKDESGVLHEITKVESPTVTALKALKQGGAADDPNHCTMFGELDVQNTTPISTRAATTIEQRVYQVELVRTVAMITLAIDGSGLRDGVIITPKSYRLVNVPARGVIGGDNVVTRTEDRIAESCFTSGLEKRWGGTCNPTMAATLGGKLKIPNYTNVEGFDPHGADENVRPLFMFENKQGEGKISYPNPGYVGKDEAGKTPPSGKKDYCSYIEVKATYYYNSTHDSGTDKPTNLPSYLSGEITYRFYLGNNVTTNFDVERNKHYQLTLSLSNWGGLRERGVITGDGNGNYGSGSGNDEVWRVITDLGVNNAGDNLIHVPANGSRLDIKLVGQLYNNIYNETGGYKNVHISYLERGGSGANLIWAQNHDTDLWDGAPSEKGLKQYMWPNDDGSYSLRIYIKPYGQSEMNSLVNNNPHTTPAGQALSNVELWRDYGYREHIFYIKQGSTNHATYTVRQWLPMPVMRLEPTTENPKGQAITDPRDADLYFSRFDIYDGELLTWCPGEHGLWTADLSEGGSTFITATDQLRIVEYNSNNYVLTDFVNPPTTTFEDYTYTIGFHTTTAFFETDKTKYNYQNIKFNNGVPQTMLEFAFFAAANSELPPDKGTMFYTTPDNVKLLSHYGLATRTAWSRIEADGVPDPRWPLRNGTRYWTSTIAQQGDEFEDKSKPDDWNGTKSMVYIFGQGKEGAYPAYRGQKFPGRLVYRKRDYSFPQ